MNRTNSEALDRNRTHYKGRKKVIRNNFSYIFIFLVKGNKLEVICAQTAATEACRCERERRCCSVGLLQPLFTCRSAVAGAAGTRSTTEQIH